MAPVPEISDEKLSELAKKIKPVVRFSKITNSKGSRFVEDSEGDLYFIKPVDPRGVAFTWDPKKSQRAKKVNPNSYKTIETHHNYGYHGFFKPSIAEVLSQIPEEDLERAVAFETDHSGFTSDQRFHTAVTRLYELFPNQK